VAKKGEELVRAHVGMGGAAAPGGLEVDADATVGEGPDGVVSEGRAQEISAQSFELLAVAAVDGGRGVEVHAEGGLGQRRPRRRLGRRCEVRTGEPELHAGSQRGVKVEVVVLGGAGGPVDPREHGRHSLGGRRRRGQEADPGAVLLEGAVGGETMQVHI